MKSIRNHLLILKKDFQNREEACVDAFTFDFLDISKNKISFISLEYNKQKTSTQNKLSK